MGILYETLADLCKQSGLITGKGNLDMAWTLVHDERKPVEQIERTERIEQRGAAKHKRRSRQNVSRARLASLRRTPPVARYM